MELKDAVDRYLEVVKEFDRPMPLSKFGIAKEDVESMLSAWDEDYHLHRHFNLLDASTVPAGTLGEMREHQVNGLAIVAIVIHQSILDVLE